MLLSELRRGDLVREEWVDGERLTYLLLEDGQVLDPHFTRINILILESSDEGEIGLTRITWSNNVLQVSPFRCQVIRDGEVILGGKNSCS